MVFLVCARIINRDKKVQGYLGKYYIKFFGIWLLTRTKPHSRNRPTNFHCYIDHCTVCRMFYFDILGYTVDVSKFILSGTVFLRKKNHIISSSWERKM